MSESRTVFISPGQGSQREGLYELAEKIPEVKESYDLADEIVFEMLGTGMLEGKSISDWAKEGTDDEFAHKTMITQPLIVTTTVGLIKCLRNHEDGDTSYGHSLGELPALFGAGSLTEADTIRLAILRGQFSFEAASRRAGRMAVLWNTPADILERLRNGEEEGVVISTANSPDQHTISGYAERVTAFVEEIKNKYQGIKGLTKEERRQLPNALLMKIGGGFHSFLMAPAQKQYRKALDDTGVYVPNQMNWFSNYSHDYEASPDRIRHALVEQLVEPVDFWADIGRLVVDGHVRLIEVGAGAPLSKDLKQQQLKGNLPADLEIVAFEKEVIGKAG